MPIASIILALIQAAPGAISEITALYGTLKGVISTKDQASIDAALAAAQSSDAAATAAADAALDTASQQ